MLRFNRSHLPLDQKMKDFWDINGFLVIEDFYAHEECDKLIYKSEKLINDFFEFLILIKDSLAENLGFEDNSMTSKFHFGMSLHAGNLIPPPHALIHSGKILKTITIATNNNPTFKVIEKNIKFFENIIGSEINLNIVETKKPELDAKLVASSITQQLERRVLYRRAMKRAVTNTMRLGANGIKVKIAGRLNGAEIARSEWYQEGRVPLHTLKANIDYGVSEAKTTYGIIGVKVWIFQEEEIN